jgi:NAD(P)-dependent dehydrogenase (short-subunit alcohol dehydrogenase family)
MVDRSRELDGRRALVVGGSRGVGRAIADLLVDRGARVALAARTVAELETARRSMAERGIVVHTVVADVSEPTEAQQAVTSAAGALGGLDLLVNCAAIHGPIGPLPTTDPEEWWNAVRVDLYGTYLTIRAGYPYLATAPHAAILNLSGGGATAPLPNFTAYGSAKAAVVRLTETLAAELVATSVRVYAIAPGAVNTRLLDNVLAAGETAAGAETYLRSREQQQSGGVPAERAARLAAFLATKAASPLNGRLISAVWDPWERWEADPSLLTDLAAETFTLRRVVPSS